MSKRVLSTASSPASSLASSHPSVDHAHKRQRRVEGNQPALGFSPNYIASAENAAQVDADPPLQSLLKAASASLKTVEGTEAIVHWMRMADLRSECLEPRLSKTLTNLG
jgi:deoxyribodipyrimidine photo-lyase